VAGPISSNAPKVTQRTTDTSPKKTEGGEPPVKADGKADVGGAGKAYGKGHDSKDTLTLAKEGAGKGIYLAESLEQAAHKGSSKAAHNVARGMSKASVGASVAYAGLNAYKAGSYAKKALTADDAETAKKYAGKAAEAGVDTAGATAKVGFVAGHAAHKNTGLVRGAGVVAGGVAAYQAGKSGAAAVESFKQGDVRKGIQQSGETATNAGWAGKMIGVPAAKMYSQKAATKAAAKAALDGVADPKVAGKVANAATKAALKHGGESASVAGIKAANKAGMKFGASNVGITAGQAATKAAAKGGAKALGRLVPGLSVAIAAGDAAQAGAIQADPKASTGKKVAAWATAGLSSVAAGASFVPGAGTIVAGVASGASLVTGFIRDLL
jgi:hypothetical protein